MIAAALVAVFGGLDDRFDLDYRIKLLGQLLAALIVVLGAMCRFTTLTLDDRVLLPEWISVPLTVLFLVGITNAINLADGLDGLAGGTTFLCLCALAILAYSSGQVTTAALALAFAGAVLGFLRFNTFPASVFMGDAGSQLAGICGRRAEPARHPKRRRRHQYRRADVAVGAADSGHLECDGAAHRRGTLAVQRR